MKPFLYVVAAMIATTGVAFANDSAQVAQGKALYTEFCQRCHGVDGQRGEGFQTPIWGPGAARGKFKTVQELFEYMQISMPFDKPERVTDEQRWPIIAYMLSQHGVIKPGDTLDIANAPSIEITHPAGAVPDAAATSAKGASADAGEEIFKRCRQCHDVGSGAKNKVGPQLNGIIGRKAGTVEGFKYSPANVAAGQKGLVWTEAELSTYLADPRKYMPGNRMAFVGLKDEQERKDLIAYLKNFPK